MPQIHPSALVSDRAVLADDVTVGPFAVIEGDAVLEAGVKIGGHVWIADGTTIGSNSSIGWGSVIGADPQDLGFDPATKSGVRIGSNNTLREYVTIHRGSKEGAFTSLGDSNFLMTGVHLAHDVSMADHNIMANNVLLAGHIEIGSRVFLGGGAGFHQFIRIGDFAMVQGNAAISQDVPPYVVAHGQNQLACLNAVGLRRGGLDGATRLEIKRLFRLLFSSGLALSNAIAEAEQQTWSAPALKLLDAARTPSRKGVMIRPIEVS